MAAACCTGNTAFALDMKNTVNRGRRSMVVSMSRAIGRRWTPDKGNTTAAMMSVPCMVRKAFVCMMEDRGRFVVVWSSGNWDCCCCTDYNMVVVDWDNMVMDYLGSCSVDRSSDCSCSDIADCLDIVVDCSDTIVDCCTDIADCLDTADYSGTDYLDIVGYLGIADYCTGTGFGCLDTVVVVVDCLGIGYSADIADSGIAGWGTGCSDTADCFVVVAAAAVAGCCSALMPVVVG